MSKSLTCTVSDFAWHKLFGVPKGKLGCLLDKKERHQRIEAVVFAAQELHQRFTTTLQAYPNQEYPEVRLWVGYLGKIIHDDVTFLAEPKAEGHRIHLRTAKERRNDPDTGLRLGSATDPEATYRQHGNEEKDIKFGYNTQVAISTDGFIRETQAYTGAVSDQTGIAPLVAAQVEHQGICPPKLIYDMAGGNGKTRAEVAQASNGQTQLIAQAFALVFDPKTWLGLAACLRPGNSRLNLPGVPIQASAGSTRCCEQTGDGIRPSVWRCLGFALPANDLCKGRAHFQV
jgi:hypothetical protein